MNAGMHDSLIAYFNSQIGSPLTEEEVAIVRATFKPKRLRKHQYLLQEGEVCKFGGFVTKGAMKTYTVDENGKEDILGLYIENWWVGDRESFLNGTPTPYNIDAFEDTELLLFGNEDGWQQLMGARFMQELMRILTERQALQLLKRVHTTKTMTAEMRLADLERTYPEFLQRFPQHIIASYLGMTKETLSRIRAQSAKR
ncbi:MAG: Crp/Fnr family transcriptional regulator [Bacteroidia bacterium]